MCRHDLPDCDTNHSGYSRRLDVINRGLSGYNSSQGLKIIHEVIPSPSVADVKYIVSALSIPFTTV